jgi:hypothetical protein
VVPGRFVVVNPWHGRVDKIDTNELDDHDAHQTVDSVFSLPP